MKTLIIDGHPDLQDSVANKTVIEEIQASLPHVRIRHLGELYPDYHIDVEAEQKALLEADLIVWQFPFFWYSLPALMKKWLDEVFLHGFSHGSTAKLAGKKLLVSITTGAPAEAYTGGQGSIGDIRELVSPFASIAAVCRLDYQGAMWVNGVGYTQRQTREGTDLQRKTAKEYARRLIEKISSIH